MDLGDTRRRVQPVPGLSEAHEVHHVRTHRKCRAIGDHGEETFGVGHRPSEQFASGVDRDHVRVPGDERSRGDPGSGAHVEHADTGKRTEREEHPIRV